MGGKKGVPSAKEKAAEKAKQQQEDKARWKEDADWEAAGEGKKSKAQAKKASKDEDRQGAQAKKLEARRLAEEEAAALAASTKKPAAAPKVWINRMLYMCASKRGCTQCAHRKPQAVLLRGASMHCPVTAPDPACCKWRSYQYCVQIFATSCSMRECL